MFFLSLYFTNKLQQLQQQQLLQLLLLLLPLDLLQQLLRIYIVDTVRVSCMMGQTRSRSIQIHVYICKYINNYVGECMFVVHIHIYIYIYVCVCVFVYVFSSTKYLPS